MRVKELKEKLADMPDDLHVMVGCLDRDGKPLMSPAWSVHNIEERRTTCVLEIHH